MWIKKLVNLGDDVTHLSPQDRNVGVVFQNYALFKHMTVEENIAFGLKMRQTNEYDIQNRLK